MTLNFVVLDCFPCPLLPSFDSFSLFNILRVKTFPPINLKPFTPPIQPTLPLSVPSVHYQPSLSLESCGCHLSIHHLLKWQARTFPPTRRPAGKKTIPLQISCFTTPKRVGRCHGISIPCQHPTLSRVLYLLSAYSSSLAT